MLSVCRKPILLTFIYIYIYIYIYFIVFPIKVVTSKLMESAKFSQTWLPKFKQHRDRHWIHYLYYLLKPCEMGNYINGSHEAIILMGPMKLLYLPSTNRCRHIWPLKQYISGNLQCPKDLSPRQYSGIIVSNILLHTITKC